MTTTRLQHVGVIMDGNGRWAKKRGLPRPVGHKHGSAATSKIIEAAINNDLSYLTLYVFSAENWKRPATEVSLLMKLLIEMVKKEIQNLQDKNVKVILLGDLQQLPEEPRKVIEAAANETSGNTGLVLQLALSYGGRDEIINATRKYAVQCIEQNEVTPITEESFSQLMYNKEAPDPELIIRTGGEQRLSNFLLWQSAYSEFYFTDKLWPDFNAADFKQALDEFNNRERRFGKVLNQ